MDRRPLFLMGFVLAAGMIGNIWAVELGDYYVIEDFESYNSTAELRAKWDSAGATEDYYGLNLDYPHSGVKCLRLDYWTYHSPYYCGVSRTETPWVPADWTFGGEAETLSLWFSPGADPNLSINGIDELYARITDSSSRVALVHYTDMRPVSDFDNGGYQEWNIGLEEFVDDNPSIDLTNVKMLEIGVLDGLGNPPAQMGYGFIYFDDIRLYPYVLPAIYVATDGDDVTGDGSKENPFRTIQKGIDTATDVNTVIVLPGTYVENINFNGKNITLRSTDPNDSNIVANTIIDGSLGNPVVTFSGTESPDSVLSGFTITNAAPTIDISTIYGGGIRGNGTLATIEKNNISGNVASNFLGFGHWGYGGGLCDCDGTIQYNIISGNTAYCDIEGESSGGGLYGCDGTIKNNVILDNRACNSGGGLYGCNGIIKNCIIWKNIANEGSQVYASSIPSYSCIQDWSGSGIGNISDDPCFVEPGYLEDNNTHYWGDDFWVSGDHHLKSEAGRWEPVSESWIQDCVTSPCIDAGNPGCPLGSEPNDVNNVRRNMGAYGGTAEASRSPAGWGILADLTNDHNVDINDLEVFVGYWLDSGECIASDFNRNKHVDFNDFSIFADEWSGTISYPGPAIEYEISDCDIGSLTVEPSGQTRFSVTVEGLYIHFEDMMRANCCPDELELQMTVEDNLITIYEIEYVTMPCLCICDYPVTARLGPFEPGVYTIEVYEDWGGFIGSMIVTVGHLSNHVVEEAGTNWGEQ